MRIAIARVAPIEERRGIVAWDFGDLPAIVESPPAATGGAGVKGYPALLDDGDSVSIRVLTSQGLQVRVHHGGVRRLLLLAVPVGKRTIERELTSDLRLAIAASGFTLADLEADCLLAATDRVIADGGGPNWTADGFATLLAAAREDLPDLAATALRQAAEVCAAGASVTDRLQRLVAPAVRASADDARAQLARLVRPGFVASAGVARLPDVARYVKALDHRLAKLPEDPHRDLARLREVAALEALYVAVLGRLGRDVPSEVVEIGWQLEELRVSVFAQQLGATRGVSAAKIAKAIRSWS